MTKRMLIDDTHPEETRVVVVNGNKVEDVEFESSNRKQIKGNIYLAKVMRIEPSLQAAFVDYGGNKGESNRYSTGSRGAKVSLMVRALEKDILKGVYEKGTLMPSQNDLCSKYDVSSRTVREAFKILEAKGLVTISQRRRAHVNTNSLDQYVDSISTSMMSDGGSDGKLFADLLDTYTILEISAVKTLCRKNDRSALLRKPESHLTAMQEDIDTQSDSGS